jgi:hypothetical protein
VGGSAVQCASPSSSCGFNISDSGDIDPTATQTIGWWMNWTSNSTYIFRKGSTIQFYAFTSSTNGTMEFGWSNDGSGQGNTGGIVSNGKNHCVVMINNGTHEYVVIDNSTDTASIKTVSGAITTSTDPFTAFSDRGGTPGSGRIDELFFSNATMSTADIQSFCSKVPVNTTVGTTSVSQTLNVSIYYYNATYSKTFNLGNLLSNTSYGIGLTATLTDGSNQRTQVFFNGSLLDETYSAKVSNPAGGYLFSQDSSGYCASGAGGGLTCFKNYLWGAHGIVNQTGDIQSVNETLNGTIDEIIVGDTAVGNVTKFGKVMMEAWTYSQPTITFSPTTSTSNIYTLNVTIAFNQSTLPYYQDANISITFSDPDFVQPENITVQFRVNGSLVNTTIINATNGSFSTSILLYHGNYSIGATLNVTAWAQDYLYTSVNTSIQTTVIGFLPATIINMSCSAYNTTAINCSWINPSSFVQTISLWINGTNIQNVSNSTTNFMFQNLYPSKYYNISILTFSNTSTIDILNTTQSELYEFEKGDGTDTYNYTTMRLSGSTNTTGIVKTSAQQCVNNLGNCNMTINDSGYLETNLLSIAFWYKGNQTDGYLTRKGSQALQGFSFYINPNGTVSMDIKDNSLLTSGINSNISINDSLAHCIIGIINTSAQKLVIDNVTTATGSSAASGHSAAVSTSPTYILSSETGSYSTIDEFMISTTEFSTSQIQAFCSKNMNNLYSIVGNNLQVQTGNDSISITSFSPATLNFTVQENTTQNFSITVASVNNVIISWFKDNVFQVFGNIFSWVIGYNDQGQHNITAIANDTYGVSAQITWNVTVNDTFPAPASPVFTPNGGLFRTYIPVVCRSTNSYDAVSAYDISYTIDNVSYVNISVNNLDGYVQFDITQYPYYTNFTFNCTARGIAGNTSSLSNVFMRDYVNEFYATTQNYNGAFYTLTPYTMSLYYDAQSPGRNVTVQYSYADCNGDGLYDYVYNYTSTMPSRVKQSFICAFQKGNVNFEIGVFLNKNSTDSWAGTGCSTDYDYSNTCLVKKNYGLVVA